MIETKNSVFVTPAISCSLNLADQFQYMRNTNLSPTVGGPTSLALFVGMQTLSGIPNSTRSDECVQMGFVDLRMTPELLPVTQQPQAPDQDFILQGQRCWEKHKHRPMRKSVKIGSFFLFHSKDPWSGLARIRWCKVRSVSVRLVESQRLARDNYTR